MKKTIGSASLPARIAVRIILILLAVAIIYPFYNCALQSVLPYEYSTTFGFYLFPPAFDFTNYSMLLASPFVQMGAMTTFAITVLGTGYSMILTVAMGYALSRKGFPARGFFINLVLITMFFSGGMIPNYLLVKNLGMMDSIASMILPLGITPFWLILMKGFFSSIPNSLVESARIDGANELTVLARIMLPVAMPIIATITLFYAVARWNEWFNGMLYIRTQIRKPLQLILRDMLVQMDSSLLNSSAAMAVAGNERIYSQSLRMAMVMLTAIPILCVYPFLQKYFVKGIMVGSIKG
jgi:putative aldouronate transport system permease protein